MNVTRGTLERLARVLALLVGGFLGTALVALALFPLTRLVQSVVYDAAYLSVGPSEATKLATVSQVVLVIVLAASVPALVAHHLTARTTPVRPVLVAVGALFLLLVVLVVGPLLGLLRVSLLGTFAVVLVAFAGVLAILRYRYGVRSGGVTALAGGLPVVFLLLLLAGFGLGWGWGYVVTAEAVPVDSVDGADADFEDVPQVRDDLFDRKTCEGDGTNRVCHLALRGYEHERAAVRFLDRHGVRCPYVNGKGRDPGSFVTEHDGRYYRVSCGSHGD